MTTPLPRLRNDIEVMPSPAPEQPGLLLRDPYRYSSAMVIVPPALVPALMFLDGNKTQLELHEFLTRRFQQVVPSDIVENFVGALQEQGFLDTEHFHRMRDSRWEEFRIALERKATHAGSAYPLHADQLRVQLGEYMKSAAKADVNKSIGIAAPHVSPFGGWKSYAAAYSRLSPELGEKTFVILGTSHYGRPEMFGLTRKPFVTPLGTLNVDTALVDRIAERAGNAVVMEDYCHSIEHSIEFQCIFLQHAVGTGCRILPILCGPFLDSLMTGKAPESNDAVRRFFDVLGEMAEREAGKLFWVLGIDLAHIGKRYGDEFAAHAEQGDMADVRRKDVQRLEQVCAGDGPAFLDLVTPNRDELRWCGYSPLYTFLKTVPGARGNVLNYEQWNIDEESVVSFAALDFVRN